MLLLPNIRSYDNGHQENRGLQLKELQYVDSLLRGVLKTSQNQEEK